MPRRRRTDKEPLNRALTLFDGDNLRDGLFKLGHIPPFDTFLDWVADPDNLGIDAISRSCLYLTVPSVAHKHHLVLPVKDRTRFCMHPFVVPRPPEMVDEIKWGSRYKDEVMFRGTWDHLHASPAIRTVVAFSSDGGHEGGMFRFGDEVRQGYDRFKGIRRPEWGREVVTIVDPSSAPADWRRQVPNSESLVRIIPELGPRIRRLRPDRASA